ncbi:uncharacterized protein LOC117106396 [Anneissia japonica]|uniref:uncharacterized protein LOC117106396 n=1 Tax=Anneissia japonica TaxID=1529436 RepID=UPI0014256CB6|nr:uncharacterized protein LOC117106396 [Anneissia japonica]
MGPQWKQVGVRLGLSWNRIQQIHSDFNLSQDHITSMLIEWREQQNYETNQVEIMYRVLREQGLAEPANTAFGSQLISVDQPFLVEAGEGHARKLDRRHKEQDGKCFDDQDLLFICDQLEPGSWKRLGVRLGLKWTDTNKIAINNKQVKDCVMELLVTWRDSQSTKQVPVMVNALRQQNFSELARNVCKRLGYSDELEDASTQINLPHISTPVQGNCFNDQDLLFICDQLDPGSWRRLGVRLGLKWTDTNKIANNNSLVKDRIMELLVSWRDDHSANQVPTMVNALRQQKLLKLVRRVCERHGYRDVSEVAATQINATKQRHMHGCLHDIDMVVISESLDNDWKEFGIYLGLQRSEINRIELDFSPPIVDARIEMLVQWRERQEAEVRHLKTISDALIKIKRMDIKDKLLLTILDRLPVSTI